MNEINFPVTVYLNEDGNVRVIQGSYDKEQFFEFFGGSNEDGTDDLEFIGVANNLHELIMQINTFN